MNYPEHTIIVAITVEAESHKDAQERIMRSLPKPSDNTEGITAWWIAEDERFDGSDNDSAIFIPSVFSQDDARRAVMESLLSTAFRVEGVE